MSSHHTFEGTIEVMTTKAIAFMSYYWEAPIWFPRSQVELVDDENSYVLKVRDWLCRKNGIDEFTSYNAEQVERFNTYDK